MMNNFYFVVEMDYTHPHMNRIAGDTVIGKKCISGHHMSADYDNVDNCVNDISLTFKFYIELFVKFFPDAEYQLVIKYNPKYQQHIGVDENVMYLKDTVDEAKYDFDSELTEEFWENPEEPKLAFFTLTNVKAREHEKDFPIRAYVVWHDTKKEETDYYSKIASKTGSFYVPTDSFTYH